MAVEVLISRSVLLSLVDIGPIWVRQGMRGEPQPLDVVAREVVLRADFDLLDEDGCSWISTRFLRGPEPPRAGDTVYLLDGQGRGCVGHVDRVQGWYACVRPDWSTWTG